MANLPPPSLPSPSLPTFSSFPPLSGWCCLTRRRYAYRETRPTQSLTHSHDNPNLTNTYRTALPRNKQQRRNPNSELATSYIAHETNLPSLSRSLSRACRPPARRKAPYRPLLLRIWGNREHNPINAPLHVHVHAVPVVTPLTPKKHSAESSAVNRMYSNTASTLSACS